MGLSSTVVGPVTVTFATGHTRTFPSVVAAQAATDGLTLEARRGAWFEVAGAPKASAPAAAPTPSARVDAGAKPAKKPAAAAK